MHDVWRLTPALTLSAGVRYEYTSPGVDVRDRANLYDVDDGHAGAGGKGRYAAIGLHAGPEQLRSAAGTRLDGRDDTVVRAAYGIYYDQSALAPSEGLVFQPAVLRLPLLLRAAAVPAVR